MCFGVRTNAHYWRPVIFAIILSRPFSCRYQIRQYLQIDDTLYLLNSTLMSYPMPFNLNKRHNYHTTRLHAQVLGIDLYKYDGLFVHIDPLIFSNLVRQKIGNGCKSVSIGRELASYPSQLGIRAPLWLWTLTSADGGRPGPAVPLLGELIAVVPVTVHALQSVHRRGDVIVLDSTSTCARPVARRADYAETWCYFCPRLPGPAVHDVLIWRWSIQLRLLHIRSSAGSIVYRSARERTTTFTVHNRRASLWVLADNVEFWLQNITTRRKRGCSSISTNGQQRTKDRSSTDMDVEWKRSI